MFYKLNPARLQFYQKVPQMARLIISISRNGEKHHFNYSLFKNPSILSWNINRPLPTPSVTINQIKPNPPKNPHGKKKGKGVAREFFNMSMR